MLHYMNYVEISMNQINERKSTDLSNQIRKEIPILCIIASDICKTKLDRESMDASPSVDLRRGDPSKIDTYINIPGGTSLKNFVHMG